MTKKIQPNDNQKNGQPLNDGCVDSAVKQANGGNVDTASVQESENGLENTEKTTRGKKRSEHPVIQQRQSFEEEIIEKSEKKTQKATGKKKMWLNTLFLVIICAVSIFIMIQLALTFNDGEIKPFGQLLAETDWNYALIALAVLLLIMLLDALKFSIITRVTDGRASFRTSAKVSLLGKYYDNITPFSTGGQPMQIYYLHKKGYSGGNSGAIVLIKYFAQMIAWLTVSFILLAFRSDALSLIHNDGIAKTLQIGAWVGWVANAILPVAIVMFAVLPKISAKILNFFVFIGSKLRLVKDREKTENRVLNVVHDYKNCFKIMVQRPLRCMLLLLTCFFEPVVTLVFPYFIIKAFAGSAVASGVASAIDIMALHIFAMYSVAIIPTPGNSGAVETTFSMAFSQIAGSVLFWVVFVWRFLIYYIYIVIGIIINVFEVIRNFVRHKRSEKNLSDRQ